MVLFEGVLFAAPIFNPRTNHWYDIVEGPTWDKAEANAVALGGHLVTINDQQEQEWLVTNFGSSGSLWIGFSDSLVEGTWVWSSGQAVTYTNWDQWQPDNAGSENWAVMNWGPQGAWNDLQSSYGWVAYGIAEWPVTSVPVADNPALIILLVAGIISIVFISKKVLINNRLS